MKVYRDIVNANGKVEKTPIFNLMEGTYSGTDMGERSISATIEFPTPIDFHAGDYVEFDIADLIRGENVEGGHYLEKFYIYTMPTIKKVASCMSVGNAFEHTVTFYPRQYELGCVQMRDVLQEINSGIIYTGYDEFSFYGGAKTLIDRIMAVLQERYPKTDSGVAGVDYWDYRISDMVNEERNTALEKFQFNFSGNSVMEAVMKLNDEDGINTKFWINERMIYIGFKRPYICGVDDANVLRTTPFEFRYGKTSHLPISANYGNLFTITKSLGSNSPITRLYAYGSDRNLHRFYCADRIKSGRYVNRLMLPSFEDDGKTDYIDSTEGIAKFGVREGSKTFDEIYPSLRYFTYGDLRSVQYCIKIMGSGVESDTETYDSGKTYQYPIARVQCYKVEPLEGTKVNHLVESAPPVDLAVFCHATGKTVKVILYAAKDSKTALQRQQEAAGVWDNGNYRVPAHTLHGKDYIAGSAFAIHDSGYECAHTHEKYSGSVGAKQQDDSGTPLTRDDWFVDSDKIEIYDGENKITNPAKEKYRNEVSIHQINYTDTHWITDIFEFTSYDQTSFQRQGYSAYCWARINNTYPESIPDSIEVNQVVDIPDVVIEDTDLNTSDNSNQQYFEMFIRDVGFKINEQTWFGDYVFLFGNCTVNFLDGNLGGYGFTCPKENDSKKVAEIYIPALLEDGSENEVFFRGDDYVSASQCRKAYEQGAYWRILLQRADTEVTNYWLPNINVNGNAGDHFVFLDIYMPDIYQRVAERRLAKEARKYLDANDDGDIQYSFDFDKVRMIQIPAFGLQMREGAIMRVVDDDLDIKTLNSSTTKFKQESGLVSRKSLTRTEVESIDKDTNVYYTSIHRDIEYIKNMYPDKYHGVYGYAHKFVSVSSGKEYFTLQISNEDAYSNQELYFPNGILRIRLADRHLYSTSVGGTTYLEQTCFVDDDKPARYIDLFILKSEKISDTEYKLYYSMGYGVYSNDKVYYGFAEYDMRTKHTETSVVVTHKSYVLPEGTRFFCPSQQLTEFRAGKYYEVTMDCENTTMPFFDKNGMHTLFALVNNLGDYASWFVPEYASEEITDIDDAKKWRRFVFKFTLDANFNDTQDYYPAIQYISDGYTEVVSVRLISIIESDSEALKDLKYADLNIDTISIRFHDNTREHGVMLQNGIEPSRRVSTEVSPMIREISATVKEESRASNWSQMMSRIEDNEITSDQIIRTQEQIANASRRHYRELLALRDSIFDPDGTCDQTFLHIMMLQVGADSMNYQLDKTHQSANGNALSNCRVDRVEGSNDKFKILSSDVLRHYVYTEDEPMGLWYVTAPTNSAEVGVMAEFDLAQVSDDGGEQYYPTYFVAIKCPIHNSQNAEWVCEPVQHSVNELSEYYYFNWGILNPDKEGHYTLIETRGNAYMYGDNLICGKISTLAGQSYFDLTHGNFVLSDGTNTALSYINGVLTISGISDNIEKVLSQLEGLENMSIGGENLYSGKDITIQITGEDMFPDAGEKYIFPYFYTLEANKTAVVSAVLDNSEYLDNVSNLYVVAIPYGTGGLTEEKRVLFSTDDDSAYISYAKIYDLQTPIESGSTKQLLYLFAKDDKGDLESVYPKTGDVYARNVMVQYGTKATSYHPYTEHAVTVSNSFVETAVKNGSTQIAGGLTLTNLLLLKNEQKEISAGMSGLSDNVTMWGGGSYEDAVKQANGLASELAKLLPVLITKEGTGSNIGCFKVINDHAVEVQGTNGDKIVIDSNDNQYPSISVVKNGNVVTKISSEVLSSDSADANEIGAAIFSGVYGTEISTVKNGSVGTAQLQNVDISKFSTYSVTYKNATYLKIGMYIFYEAQGVSVDNLSIKFDLYIGDYKIATISGTSESMTISPGTEVRVRTARLLNISTIARGTYSLVAKNISVTADYGKLKGANMSAYIHRIWFSSNNDITDNNDANGYNNSGSINFMNTFANKTIVGSNGIQIESKQNGLVQILNGKAGAYVRTFGLPTIASDSGQIYNTNNAKLNEVRKAFNDWASLVDWHGSGSSVESSFREALSALQTKLDDLIKNNLMLGIK